MCINKWKQLFRETSLARLLTFEGNATFSGKVILEKIVASL